MSPRKTKAAAMNRLPGAAEVDQIACAVCGEMNAKDALVCTNCGEEMNPVAATPAPRKRFFWFRLPKRIRRILVIVLIIAIATVAVFALVNRGGDASVSSIEPYVYTESVVPGSVISVHLRCGDDVKLTVPEIPATEDSVLVQVEGETCEGSVRFDRAK